VLEQPEVYVSSGWEKFDGDGHLTDEVTRQQVRALLEALVNAVESEAFVLAS
jgi:hypothetical protein